MNNGWCVLLCVFSKIGFPPFIMMYVYVWIGSNYVFLGVDMCIKLGYVYVGWVCMDGWMWGMEMWVWVVVSVWGMGVVVGSVNSMKVVVLVGGMMNGINMYNCMYVCGVGVGVGVGWVGWCGGVWMVLGVGVLV